MANETSAADSGGQQAVLETAHLVDLVWGKLMAWAEAFVELLPNLAVAILIVLFFAVLSRFAQRFVARVLSRISSNDQISSLAGTTARVATLSVGLFLALGVLELEKTVTSLLAGVGVVASPSASPSRISRPISCPVSSWRFDAPLSSTKRWKPGACWATSNASLFAPR